MKINKVTFYNYKPFMGKNTLNLNSEKKIVIVKGDNGAGKTSFLNGLIWCLYPTPFLEENIINNDVLYGMKMGTEDEMYIEIDFSNNGDKYILRKGIKFKRLNEKNYDYNNYQNLNIISSDKNPIEYELETDIRSEINSVLNEVVKNYFFFDSNRIDEFMKEEHGKEVKKAIKDLLNIETVIRARDHIKKIENDQRSKIFNSEDYDEQEIGKNNNLNKLNEDLKLFNDQRLEFIDSKKTIQKKIEEKESEIRQNEKNSLYIEEKRKILENLRNLKSKNENNGNEINGILEKSFFIFGDKLFTDARNTLKIKNNSSINVSSKALKNVLSESLKKETCLVCDQELEENLINKIKQKILEIKPEENDGKTFEKVEEFTNFINEGGKKCEELFRIQKELNNIKSDLEEHQRKLKTVESEIDEDLEDVKTLKNSRDLLEEEKQKLGHKIISMDFKIKNVKEEKEKLEKDLKDIVDKKQENNEDKKMLEVIQSINNEIEHIYNNYEKDQLISINNKIDNIFKNLNQKRSFTHLFVDLENYNLNVYRNNVEENIIKQISTAERQLLSLSLIMSLAVTSEKNGLFVMDNPFTHLDEEHKINVLRYIPKMIDQFIILAPKKEIDNKLIELCEQDLAMIAELERNLDRGYTKIKENG
ncbi:AAA family ATPase [uncultured Ilyobacter sp.]|uniref:AAA family ATPase n=1 Tax=uncultured Ilyobacter sp. TaxID=544433 RepID=UPI0029C0BF59|nr:AAA family ATPase [uncultured Ilyobacter sp.]